MTRIQTIGVAAFLALSLVLAISLPAIAISHNHHGTHITKSIQDLLPVDLDAYCKRHNPYYDASFQYIGDNAYTGKCILGNGGSTDVNVDLACGDQYGATAIDRLTSFRPPVWNCFKDMSYAGEITQDMMTRYSRHVKHDNTLTVVLVNADPAAYGWEVQYADGRLEGIDLYNLCNYYYRTGYAMDRLRDAYNAHSWTCWSA